MIVDAHTHRLVAGRDFSPALAAYYLEMYQGVDSWRTGEPWRVEDWCVPVETLIADMDRAGVDRAVVMSLGSVPLGGHDPRLADELAALCREHPNRLIGMLTADPLGGRDEAARILRDVPRLGLHGVKMLPAYSHVAIGDRRLWPVYRACAELARPLVLHTGWCAVPAGRTLAHDHPLQVEDVLADFPNLVIVIAHCGFAWSEQVLFALAAHPALYADLAYWSPTMPPWRAAQTLSHAKHLGVIDRLLWGTDYPFADPASDLAYWRAIPAVCDRLRLEPGITDADIEGLTGRNAARVFAPAADVVEEAAR